MEFQDFLIGSKIKKKRKKNQTEFKGVFVKETEVHLL